MATVQAKSAPTKTGVQTAELPVPLDRSGGATRRDEESSSTLSTNRQQQLAPISEDDDTWELVSSRKPTPRKKALFIGNLRQDMTKEELEEFVALRSSEAGHDVRVLNCSISQSQTTGHMTAHLTVDAALASLLLDRAFWPRPVYACLWKFKQQIPPSQPTGTSDSLLGSGETTPRDTEDELTNCTDA